MDDEDIEKRRFRETLVDDVLLRWRWDWSRNEAERRKAKSRGVRPKTVD